MYIKRCSKCQNRKTRVFVTGAKNRKFSGLIRFCRKNRLTESDVIIILGDAGINYYGDVRDQKLKKRLSAIPVTLLCIHGNREIRPQNIATYIEKSYMGGRVMYEEEYPSLLFAVDCSIYRFNGISAIAIGGANSEDKFYLIDNSLPYWEDERPSEITKRRFIRIMKNADWTIDVVLSHAAPIKFARYGSESLKKRRYGFDHEYIKDPDRSVEIWLDEMEEKLAYQKWYAGHYLIDHAGADITFVHDKIIEL